MLQTLEALQEHSIRQTIQIQNNSFANDTFNISVYMLLLYILADLKLFKQLCICFCLMKLDIFIKKFFNLPSTFYRAPIWRKCG